MDKIKNLRKRLWGAIEGNLYWQILTWLAGSSVGGAVLATVAKLLHHVAHLPQTNTMGYFIIGALGALTVAVCILIARKSVQVRNTEDDPSKVFGTNPVSPTPELIPLPPPPPPSINLKGEILSLYFLRPSSGFGSYSVFAKLRITNHGPDEAVIVKWNLHILIGKDEKQQAPPAGIPENMSIKRSASGLLMLGDTNFTYESVRPDLTKIPATEPYRKGIPKEGWIRFDTTDYGCEPPCNAAFYIYMEDALGNPHWIDRQPQSYRKDGDLVEHEDTNQLELSSGS